MNCCFPWPSHRLPALLLLPFFILFFGLVMDAPAQNRRSLELRVMDRDLDVPIEGVTVREAGSGATAVTDAEGRVVLEVNPGAPRVVLDLFLFGYEPARTMVTQFIDATQVTMTIEGVLTAEELVIIADRIGRTDDQLGVSIVVERDFIKSSAMIGVIEDVMSTVKLLPGVSYNGGFGSFLSVRGGEPGGLTHVMDGLVVKYPYHWGGGVSVFNPHVIDSVKLSAGIFPVRYGQATSGLMEVNSIDPVSGYRWEFAQSTSTLEGYVQLPVSANSGLFIGTRLTNYDLVFALTGQFLEDQGVTFSRVPYIYAGYLRWFSRPSPTTEWFINGFFGTDGIGLAAISPDVDTSREILNTFDFKWVNYNAQSGVGLRQLLGERLGLTALAGYEYVRNVVDAEFTEQGTRFYSETFVDAVQDNPEFAAYRPFVAPGGSFSINQPNGFFNATILHHIQLRADLEYQLSDDLILQAGTGGFLSLNSYVTELSIWAPVLDENGDVESVLRSIDESAPANRLLNPFVYASAEWGMIPGRLALDIGVRVDHALLSGEGFSLNTRPALGPRALLRWTPEPPRWLESVSATLGTGIFTKVPFDASLINENLATDDFELDSPKSYMVIAGWEARAPAGLRFKIEGYYKYLYDRFYLSLIDQVQGDGSRVQVPRVYTDGIGQVGGFDLVLDRRTSRVVDGMLAYSFIYARYLDPSGDPEEGSASEPRGRWYYPPFHRFHTLNVLLNYKPRDWFTFTTTVTFATGALESGFGEKRIEPVFAADGQGDTNVAETYTRDQFYLDDNRQGWVLPVDLRASFHSYAPGGKVYREFYLGAEDVLSPLLSRIAPESNAVTTDRYTGEDTRAADQNFSFPIISIGLRVSY